MVSEHLEICRTVAKSFHEVEFIVDADVTFDFEPIVDDIPTAVDF